jgi:O-antigen ligase
MAWALGVSLFVHCVVFTSVSYFGQSVLAWYLTIGIIGSLSPSRRPARRLLTRLRRRGPAISPAADPQPSPGIPLPA